jgi:hypothetical protein
MFEMGGGGHEERAVAILKPEANLNLVEQATRHLHNWSVWFKGMITLYSEHHTKHKNHSATKILSF